MTGLLLVWILTIQSAIVYCVPDSLSKGADQKSDRTGRTWHHPASSPQTLQQLQQNQPPVFLQTSTNKPGDNPVGSDPNNGGRNFEEQDKSAIPAASEQDFLSRHYGYLNVHRFDPNYSYYDRPPQFPRFPSPHTPRFGPGYRKDKYGHGYGYSCKQGDDCDEVRAANQIPPIPPPHIPPPHHAPHPAHHSVPPTPYNNHFVDVSAYSSIPSFPGHASFTPYASGGMYPPSPARFNDLHMPLPHQMPSRFYHGRYLHDEVQGKDEENNSDTKKERKRAVSRK